MSEIIREQPTMEPANVSSETLDESAVSEVGSQNCESGNVRQVEEKPEQNKFGKFKDVDTLLDAYNNLEAEFTKKCQRLSEIEKDKIENDSSSTNLDEKFDQFLAKYSEANQYSEEIKNYVFSDKQLQKIDNPFEVAWAKVVLSHVADFEKKAEDPIINRYVLSSDQIKNKIVENYLNALNEQKPPIIISSQKGERVSSVVPDTPKTLNEARSLVEKMFS